MQMKVISGDHANENRATTTSIIPSIVMPVIEWKVTVEKGIVSIKAKVYSIRDIHGVFLGINMKLSKSSRLA